MAPGQRRWSPATAGLILLLILGLAPSDAQTASSSGVLSQIKARGKIVVATDSDYPPFEFMENGKLTGYCPALARYVAKDLGVQIEEVVLPFTGILPGLLARKFDFASAVIGMTPERASKFAFTVPISASLHRAIKRKGDNRIAKVDDLSDKVVGVILNSAAERYLRAFDQKLKAKGLQGVKEIKLFNGNPEAIVALQNRQLDAVVDDITTLMQAVTKRPGAFEVVAGNVAEPTWQSWIVRPEDTDLLDAINSTLVRLNKSGVQGQLQKKWLGVDMQTPIQGYLPPGAAGHEP